MNISKFFVLGMIILSLLIISGVEQCPQTGFGGGKTEASKYGVDFIPQQGFDRLTPGKTLNLGESFYVDILLENYDKDPKIGQVCIRDDMDSAYGGILSTVCKPFNLPAAVYIDNKLDTSSSARVIFPEAEEYSYINLLADIPAKLYVSISYSQQSIISGAVSVPEPATEKALTLQQFPAPVSVSVEKSVSSIGDQLKTNLKIGFTKQGNYNITTRDFKKEALEFSSMLGTSILNCPEAAQGIIEFKNTKFISCSALLPREQTTHPLIITLNYGVKLNKDFAFSIKKEAK